ncbi:MAG: metallophosphoesterase [Kiritimatiellae bacterium]|nr:metallophosphoesterase [Kiritimatiellia bacterium]
MVNPIRKTLALGGALAASLSFAEPLPPLPDGAFTYVCIPDTQAYRSKKDPAEPSGWLEKNKSFDTRVDWIAANAKKERIFFVSHMGDVVEVNRKSQWDFASKEMAKLDGVVPYAICPGNHDQQRNTEKVGDTSLFAEAFPPSRFAMRPWYAGCFAGYTNSYGVAVCGRNANSCQLVEAGGFKFVLLHIECNAPEPALAWADEMLEKHRDRRAIIATHMFLGYTKSSYRTENAKAGWTIRPRPDQIGLVGWAKRHGREAVSGKKMWERHFSKHPNVFLIVCGDQSAVTTQHEELRGEKGNVVHAFLQDYPKSDESDWIRLFRFQPGDGRIEVYTYSPQAGKLCDGVSYWTDPKWHRFTVPFMASRKAPVL